MNSHTFNATRTYAQHTTAFICRSGN